MSRSRRVIIAIAAVLLAPTAQAAQFDHPDLLDENSGFYDTTYPPGGSYVKFFYVGIGAYQTIFASGSISNRTTTFPASASWATVHSSLYEPDNIKRKAGKNTLKQNAWVRVRISGYQRGYGAFTYGPSIFKSCKGKGTFTATGGKYMTKCGSTTFADLGLPQRIIDYLKKMLGIKKLKFTVTIP